VPLKAIFNYFSGMAYTFSKPFFALGPDGEPLTDQPPLSPKWNHELKTIAVEMIPCVRPDFILDYVTKLHLMEMVPLNYWFDKAID
jgi:hypothetical protein